MTLKEFKDFVASIPEDLDNEDIFYVDLGGPAQDLRCFKSDNGVVIDDLG